MALLEFKNTSFTYALNNTKTLTNINLEIEEGEFVVICGPTGSGKSTLLKLIKKEIRPTGKLEGQILYKNQDLNNFSLKESVETFGLVMQNVDAQIVNEKVYSELAFGLSNLGYDVSTINRRIAEMSNYFGINNWYDRSTNNLSGGEKQILNLASILTMQPKVLLIDEATSQLDPITASEFIQVLRKINQDFGITVVVVEHRLDELFSIADKVVVLNEGQIVAVDKPREIAKKINDEKLYLNLPLMLRFAKKINDEKLYLNLPLMLRFAKKINAQSYPLTIKEGKNLLKSFSNKINLLDVKENQLGSKLIELKNIYFKYYQNQKDILSGLDLIIHENEVLSIIGSNGSGKTTLLKLIARLINPYYGKIKLDKKNIKKYNNKELYYKNLSYLPQNPSEILFEMSIREELDYDNLKSEELLKLLNSLGIKELLDKHPDDLSGGEIQKVALAKILLQEPKIILLDEPTKGFDNNLKENLIKIISILKENKITIIIVSHDVEFCARVSDRIGLLFAGKIITLDKPNNFFPNNFFYTTITNKIARDKYPNVVTEQDLYEILKLNGEL